MKTSEMLALIETCEVLEKNTPYEDYYATSHWSETLDEIKSFNEITNEIVTVLSLSRFYGPTPSLTNLDSERIFFFLWPNGNPKGGFFTWIELAVLLKEFDTVIN